MRATLPPTLGRQPRGAAGLREVADAEDVTLAFGNGDHAAGVETRKPIALQLKHIDGDERPAIKPARPPNVFQRPTWLASTRLFPPGYRGLNMIVAMPAAKFNPCCT